MKSAFLIGLLLSAYFAECQEMLRANINGRDRSFLVYKSTDAYGDKAVTVFILLHENGSDARTMFGARKQWNRLSGSAILIFPNATGRQWNSENDSTNPDISFLQELIRLTREDRRVQKTKIYILFGKDHEGLIANLRSEGKELSLIRYNGERAK